jgi:hypothetical protein
MAAVFAVGGIGFRGHPAPRQAWMAVIGGKLLHFIFGGLLKT